MIITTSTTSTTPQPDLTLQKMNEVMKALFALKDTMAKKREEDKLLALQAMAFKFNRAEEYKQLDDEGRALIDNTIEVGAYIVQEETEQGFARLWGIVSLAKEEGTTYTCVNQRRNPCRSLCKKQ